MIHVQRGVQLSQARAFCFELGFLREGFADFGFRSLDLLSYRRKMFLRRSQAFGDLGDGIVQPGDIAPGIVAHFHRVRHRAMQRQQKSVDKGIILYAHVQPAIGAEFDGGSPGGFLAGGEDGLARFFLVGDERASDRHAHEILLRKRMGVEGGNVLFKPCNQVRITLHLLRENFEQLIFEPELLAQMIGPHQLQPGHIHVQVHLFLDSRITGTQRFDLRIGQCRLIHVLAGTHRALTGHNLADELLLVFYRLPKVGVKRSLGDVAVDGDFRVHVALTDNAACALLQITGPPGTVQIMQRDQPVLHVGARAHLGCAAHQHAHLTGAYPGKQLLFLDLRVGFMDEGDLFRRDTAFYEFLADVIIDIEVVLRLQSIGKVFG